MKDDKGGAGGGFQEGVRVPVSPDELCLMIEDVFEAGGEFCFAPTGKSMLPLLREHRDTVVLRAPPPGGARKYDVALFRRGDGHIVLHRVVRVEKDGTLTMCGDGQSALERGVRQEQVIGVLSAFTRKGKRVSVSSGTYRLYSAVWCALRPLRHAAGALARIGR